MDFLNFLTHMYQDPSWTEFGEGEQQALQQGPQNRVAASTPEPVSVSTNASSRVSSDFQRQVNGGQNPAQNFAAFQALFTQFQAARRSTIDSVRDSRGLANPNTRSAALEQLLAANDRALGSSFLMAESALRENPPNPQHIQTALQNFNDALAGYTRNLNSLGDSFNTDGSSNSAMLPTSTLVNAYSYLIRPALALITLLQSRLPASLHDNSNINAQVRSLTEKVRDVWQLMHDVVLHNPAEMGSFQFLKEFSLGQIDLLNRGLSNNPNDVTLANSARDHLTNAFTQAAALQNPQGDLANFAQIVQVYSARHVNNLPAQLSPQIVARSIITSSTLSFVSSICQEIDLAHRTNPEVAAQRYDRFQNVMNALLAIQPDHPLRDQMRSLQNLRWNDALYNDIQNWITLENRKPEHAQNPIRFPDVIQALEQENHPLRAAVTARITRFVEANRQNPQLNNISLQNPRDPQNGALTLLKGSQTLHEMLPILAQNLLESIRQLPAGSHDRERLLNMLRGLNENELDGSSTDLEMGKREIVSSLLSGQTPNERMLQAFRNNGHLGQNFVRSLVQFINTRSRDLMKGQENIRFVREHLHIHPALRGVGGRGELNDTLESIASNQLGQVPATFNQAPEWLTALSTGNYTEPTRSTHEVNNNAIIQDLESLLHGLEEGRNYSEKNNEANYNRIYDDLIYMIEAAGGNGGIKNTGASHRDSDLEHIQHMLDRNGLLFADSHDVIDELLNLDAAQLQGGDLGSMVTHWSEQVLNCIDGHYSGAQAWWENLFHDNERHPASFRVIYNYMGGRSSAAGSLAHQMAAFGMPNANLAENVRSRAERSFNSTHPVQEVFLTFSTPENLALNAIMVGSNQAATRALLRNEAIAQGARVALTDFLTVGRHAYNPTRVLAYLTRWAGAHPTMTTGIFAYGIGYRRAAMQAQYWAQYNRAHPEDRHDFSAAESTLQTGTALMGLAAPLWYPNYYRWMRTAELPGYQRFSWRFLAPHTWGGGARVATVAGLTGAAMLLDRRIHPHGSASEYLAVGAGTFAVLSPLALSASPGMTNLIENRLGAWTNENMTMGLVANEGQLGFTGHAMVGTASGLSGGAFASGLGMLRDSRNGYDTHFWGDMAQSSATLGVATGVNSAMGAMFHIPGRLYRRYQTRNETDPNAAALEQAKLEIESILNRSGRRDIAQGVLNSFGSAAVATAGMMLTEGLMRGYHNNQLPVPVDLTNPSSWGAYYRDYGRNFHFSAEEWANTYANMLTFEGMNSFATRGFSLNGANDHAMGSGYWGMRNLLGRARATQVDRIADRLVEGVDFHGTTPADEASLKRNTRDFVWRRLALEAFRGRDLSLISREDNIRLWQANYRNGVNTLSRRATPLEMPNADMGNILGELFDQAALYHTNRPDTPPVNVYVNRTTGEITSERPANDSDLAQTPTDSGNFVELRIGQSNGRVYLSPDTLSKIERFREAVAGDASKADFDAALRFVREYRGVPVARSPHVARLTQIISEIRAAQIESATSLFVVETNGADRRYTDIQSLERAIHDERAKTSPDTRVLTHLHQQMSLFVQRRLVARFEMEGHSYDVYQGSQEVVPEERQNHILFEMRVPGARRPIQNPRTGLGGLLDRARRTETNPETQVRIWARGNVNRWEDLPVAWRSLLTPFESTYQSGQNIEFNNGSVTGLSISGGIFDRTTRLMHVGETVTINPDSFNSTVTAHVPDNLRLGLENKGNNHWVLHNLSEDRAVEVLVGGNRLEAGAERIVNAGDRVQIRSPRNADDGSPRYVEFDLNLNAAYQSPLRNAPSAHNATAPLVFLPGMTRAHNLDAGNRGASIETVPGAGNENKIRIVTQDAAALVGEGPSQVTIPAHSHGEVEIPSGNELNISITKSDGNVETVRIANRAATTPTSARRHLPVIQNNTGTAPPPPPPPPPPPIPVAIRWWIEGTEVVTDNGHRVPFRGSNAGHAAQALRRYLSQNSIAHTSLTRLDAAPQAQPPPPPPPPPPPSPPPVPRLADWGPPPAPMGDPTQVFGRVGSTARACTDFMGQVPRNEGTVRYAVYEIRLNGDGHITEIAPIAGNVPADQSLTQGQMLFQIGGPEASMVRRANLPDGITPASRDFLNQMFVSDSSSPEPTMKIDTAVMDNVSRAIVINDAITTLISRRLTNGRHAIIATGDAANPFRLQRLINGQANPPQFAAILTVSNSRVDILTDLAADNDTLQIIERQVREIFRGRTITITRTPPPLPPGGSGPSGGPGGPSTGAPPASFPVDPAAAGLGSTNTAAPASIATHPVLHLGLNNLVGEVPLGDFYPGETNLPPIEFRVEHHASGNFLQLRSRDGSGNVSFRHPLSPDPNSTSVGTNWTSLGHAGQSEIPLSFTNNRGERRNIKVKINLSGTEVRAETPIVVPAGAHTFEIMQGDVKSLADILGVTHPDSQLQNVTIRVSAHNPEAFYLETVDNVHRIEITRNDRFPQGLTENASGIHAGNSGDTVIFRVQDALDSTHYDTYTLVLPRVREAAPPPAPPLAPPLSAMDVGLSAPAPLVANLAADTNLYAGRVRITPLTQTFSIADGETVDLYSARGGSMEDLPSTACALPSAHRALIFPTAAYGANGLKRVGSLRRDGNQVHLTRNDSSTLGYQGPSPLGEDRIYILNGHQLVVGDHSFTYQNGEFSFASTTDRFLPANERALEWTPIRSDDTAPLPIANPHVAQVLASEYTPVYERIHGRSLAEDVCARMENNAAAQMSHDIVFNRGSGEVVHWTANAQDIPGPSSENPDDLRIRGMYDGFSNEIRFNQLPGSSGRLVLNLDTGRFHYELASTAQNSADILQNRIQALTGASPDNQLHFYVNSHNGELRSRPNPESRPRSPYIDVQLEQDPNTHAVQRIHYRIVGSGSNFLTELTRTTPLNSATVADSDTLTILSTLQNMLPASTTPPSSAPPPAPPVPPTPPAPLTPASGPSPSAAADPATTATRRNVQEMRLPTTASLSLTRGQNEYLGDLLTAQGITAPAFLNEILVGRETRARGTPYMFRVEGDIRFTLTRQRGPTAGQAVEYGNGASGYSGFRHVLGEAGETVLIQSGTDAYAITLQAPEAVQTATPSRTWRDVAAGLPGIGRFFRPADPPPPPPPNLPPRVQMLQVSLPPPFASIAAVGEHLNPGEVRSLVDNNPGRSGSHDVYFNGFGQASAFTEVGLDKGKANNNEDAYAMGRSPDGRPFFIVVDGAGGYGGGDVASRIITEEASRILSQENNASLADALYRANRALTTHNQANGSNSSAVAVLTRVNPDGTLEYARVGDANLWLRIRQPDGSYPVTMPFLPANAAGVSRGTGHPIDGHYVPRDTLEMIAHPMVSNVVSILGQGDLTLSQNPLDLRDNASLASPIHYQERLIIPGTSTPLRLQAGDSFGLVCDGVAEQTNMLQASQSLSNAHGAVALRQTNQTETQMRQRIYDYYVRGRRATSSSGRVEINMDVHDTYRHHPLNHKWIDHHGNIFATQNPADTQLIGHVAPDNITSVWFHYDSSLSAVSSTPQTPPVTPPSPPPSSPHNTQTVGQSLGGGYSYSHRDGNTFITTQNGIIVVAGDQPVDIGETGQQIPAHQTAHIPIPQDTYLRVTTVNQGGQRETHVYSPFSYSDRMSPLAQAQLESPQTWPVPLHHDSSPAEVTLRANTPESFLGATVHLLASGQGIRVESGNRGVSISSADNILPNTSSREISFGPDGYLDISSYNNQGQIVSIRVRAARQSQPTQGFASMQTGAPAPSAPPPIGRVASPAAPPPGLVPPPASFPPLQPTPGPIAPSIPPLTSRRALADFHVPSSGNLIDAASNRTMTLASLFLALQRRPGANVPNTSIPAMGNLGSVNIQKTGSRYTLTPPYGIILAIHHEFYNGQRTQTETSLSTQASPSAIEVRAGDRVWITQFDPTNGRLLGDSIVLSHPLTN